MTVRIQQISAAREISSTVALQDLHHDGLIAACAECLEEAVGFRCVVHIDMPVADEIVDSNPELPFSD